MSNITYLTNRSQFIEFKSQYKVVIVKAEATWCGPCKRIKTEVYDLFDDLQKKVSNAQLVIVDTDQGRDLASYLRIKSIPTLISFINGDMIDVHMGSDKNELNAFFNKTYNELLNNY